MPSFASLSFGLLAESGTLCPHHRLRLGPGPPLHLLQMAIGDREAGSVPPEAPLISSLRNYLWLHCYTSLFSASKSSGSSDHWVKTLLLENCLLQPRVHIGWTLSFASHIASHQGSLFLQLDNRFTALVNLIKTNMALAFHSLPALWKEEGWRGQRGFECFIFKNLFQFTGGLNSINKVASRRVTCPLCSISWKKTLTFAPQNGFGGL